MVIKREDTRKYEVFAIRKDHPYYKYGVRYGYKVWHRWERGMFDRGYTKWEVETNGYDTTKEGATKRCLGL